MGKRYLLDSNTIIDYIAGLYSGKAKQWLNHIIDEEIIVSVITKIEVLSFDPDKEDNYYKVFQLPFMNLVNIVRLLIVHTRF